MNDTKIEEATVAVDGEHPLNPAHQEDAVQATSSVAEKRPDSPRDQVQKNDNEPESTPSETRQDDTKSIDSDSSDSDDDRSEIRPAANHPLESSRLDVSAYNNTDHWAQQESSLLNDEGQPNLVDSNAHSLATTPTQERTVQLDSDTSHTKGFYNAGDSSEILDLQVEGQLPEWLTGEHYTIGPGTYDVRYMRKIEIDGYLQSATATFSFGHWFDALPLANRFDMNGKRNTITYRNRLTSRRLIEKIRDHHGYAPTHPAGLFHTDSNQTFFAKFLKAAPKASKPDGEPCGARILAGIPGVDGRLFAQNHANHIQELDPFDLKPTRVLCWDEVNPAFRGYSSCPNGHFDQQTSEYINFTMEIGYQSTRYHFFSISDRDPKGRVIASISAPTGYVHSFALTPNYIILVIFPLLANSSAVKYAWNESILDSCSFYPSEPTLFHVISREKGQHLVTYRSDACFAFNHVNAFEDDRGNVNVDILCYRDDTIAHQLTTHNLRNPADMKPPRLAPSELRRFVLSNLDEETITFMANNSMIPSAASVTSRISSVWGYLRGSNSAANDVESSAPSAAPSGWYATLPVASYGKLAQPSIEMPQVNPLYNMHRYKFMYGLGFSAASSIGDGKIWDSIVKVVSGWERKKKQGATIDMCSLNKGRGNQIRCGVMA
ncbi:retinal pigment epithelial membrane protein-domain-containing protein [Fennellomyces sp. T-0311]|nr:retinal pigment epithelial membrane protein-domain-containing protein [Fennellomyces sp. T-0311]